MRLASGASEYFYFPHENVNELNVEYRPGVYRVRFIDRDTLAEQRLLLRDGETFAPCPVVAAAMVAHRANGGDQFPDADIRCDALSDPANQDYHAFLWWTDDSKLGIGSSWDGDDALMMAVATRID